MHVYYFLVEINMLNVYLGIFYYNYFGREIFKIFNETLNMLNIIYIVTL